MIGMGALDLCVEKSFQMANLGPVIGIKITFWDTANLGKTLLYIG